VGEGVSDLRLNVYIPVSIKKFKKGILLLCLLTLLATDYVCLNRCMRAGWGYSYCKRMCSYEGFKGDLPVDNTCFGIMDFFLYPSRGGVRLSD